MKTNKKIAGLVILLAMSFVAKADPIEEGKAIFLTRCAACHNINQKLTGPALAGVDQRRSLEWIVQFVRSSQSLVKSGDKDAVAIYEQFNKIPMPDHSDLTEDNIRQIVEYIKSEAKPVDSKAPFAKPASRKSNAKPLTGKDYGVFGIYLLFVGALTGALLFAVRVDAMRRNRKERSLPV